MAKYENGYGTQSEKRFLNELGNGTHSQNTRVQACSRVELLRRYIEASALRTCWGAIDRVEVLLYARDLVAQYSR
jgi:hypothetical protein